MSKVVLVISIAIMATVGAIAHTEKSEKTSGISVSGQRIYIEANTNNWVGIRVVGSNHTNFYEVKEGLIVPEWKVKKLK